MNKVKKDKGIVTTIIDSVKRIFKAVDRATNIIDINLTSLEELSSIGHDKAVAYRKDFDSNGRHNSTLPE